MQSVRVCQAGDYIRICVFTRGTRWDSAKSKKQKREWREKAWKAMNFRTCREKLEDRARCNFVPGDWHLVLTLAPKYDTQDYETLRGYWRRFIRALRESRRRRAVPAPVYLYVLEGLHGDQRLHIHCLMQKVVDDIEELHSCWPFGAVELFDIQDLDHRDNLAQYLAKEPVKLGKHQFTASHNCIKPVVVRYGLQDGLLPDVPEGYDIVHQDSTVNEFGNFYYIVCRRATQS